MPDGKLQQLQTENMQMRVQLERLWLATEEAVERGEGHVCRAPHAPQGLRGAPHRCRARFEALRAPKAPPKRRLFRA